ncbi:MAG: hypothetical protein HZC14_02040 [Candidatus Niyogibacteria bacterium]|nr:hypothetical protein [Candidatus Niyogibacteria bacterium]
MWRKSVRTFAPDGAPTPIFSKLHESKEIGVPRLGGILVWGVTFIATILFWLAAYIFSGDLAQKLNFLSRSQTWLPLFTLLAGALVGLSDDVMQIIGRGKYVAGGMRLSGRIALITLIGLAGAYWFYFKLGVDSMFVPFVGSLYLGWLFIPFFILVMLATWSGGVIDGLDGLSGGVFAAIYGAYAGIAFAQNQIDLAAFCGVVIGATLAFLWFNIPPARFYMGETGIMALTATLTVVAFLTDAVAVLPIIALPLVLASGSVIIQLFSKRFFGRKVFLIAPIHHHFEAKGWPAYKVTMRFWIIGFVFAAVGMTIALIGRV